MSTLQQLRHNLGRTWETLAEGWHNLRERATDALTRFSPLARRDDLETWEDRVIRHSSDWGLLATEIHEDDDAISVRIEVPGMEKDQFDIDVIDNHLVVRGEKRVQAEQRDGRYHVMECAYGRFERAIPLPVDVVAGDAAATYKRGVLNVRLPKHRQVRSRRIPVNTS